MIINIVTLFIFRFLLSSKKKIKKENYKAYLQYFRVSIGNCGRAASHESVVKEAKKGYTGCQFAGSDEVYTEIKKSVWINVFVDKKCLMMY